LAKESNGVKKILIGGIIGLTIWTAGVIYAAGAFRASTDLKISRVEKDCEENKKSHEILNSNLGIIRTDIAVIREQLKYLDPHGARRAEMNVLHSDSGR